MTATRRQAAVRCSLAAMAVCCAALPGCRKKPAGQGGAPRTVTTPGGVEMVLLPGGWFEMGSDSVDQVDEKRHRVYVDAFYIDKHEVTQAHYRKLIGKNPARDKAPAQPVEQIRWTDAVAYCNARSRAEGLACCYDEKTWRCDVGAAGYRLPTEAEWEYACRAGGRGAWCFGDDESRLSQHGWHKGNQTRGPQPVGRKRPNAWGLHDMHGNVWEWCGDWYGEKYYAAAPQRNPRGPEAGKMRVLRGGCWNSKPDECRSAYRFNEKPVFTDVCFGKAVSGFVGIRCVKSP